MLVVIIIAISFFIIGAITRYHSVRIKPNSLYGYRTSRSMKNKRTWIEGNRFCGMLFMVLGLVMLLAGGGIMYYLKTSTDQIVSVALVFATLGVITTIFLTEVRLKRLFEK